MQGNELSLMELHDQLDTLAKKCEEADKVYVQAKNDYDILDDVYKIKFEQIVERQPGDKMNYREHLARISDDWNEWLKTYQRFRFEKTQAELLVKKYEREFTCCMMRISSLKKEMGTFQATNSGGYR